MYRSLLAGVTRAVSASARMAPRTMQPAIGGAVRANRSAIVSVVSAVRHTSTSIVTRSSEFVHVKPSNEEYHRNSTKYSNATREIIVTLDTGVKKSDLPHREPVDVSDRAAKVLVWMLRKVTGAFYRQKYIHYACVFETLAAVPGMVAGMVQHLRSLRRMEHNRFIKKLLDEAENERMHLMTFMEMSKPTLLERSFVLTAQGAFFIAFSMFYFVSERTAHRFVGYLEEEAVKSYTEMLHSIDTKTVLNPPAPAIAKQYWNLPDDATLRDVVLVVRADEMDHRDINHDLSDRLGARH